MVRHLHHFSSLLFNKLLSFLRWKVRVRLHSLSATVLKGIKRFMFPCALVGSFSLAILLASIISRFFGTFCMIESISYLSFLLWTIFSYREKVSHSTTTTHPTNESTNNITKHISNISTHSETLIQSIALNESKLDTKSKLKNPMN